MGSFGSYSAEASVGGVTRGRWDYYVAGGYENEDGWREATERREPECLHQCGPQRPGSGDKLSGIRRGVARGDCRVSARKHLPDDSTRQLHGG